MLDRTRTFLRDPSFPMYNAQSNAVRVMLGLSEKAKLPGGGMTARVIQGIKVWVNPFVKLPNGRKSSTHRVMAECPHCSKVLSAGRLHQHVCKRGA